MNWIISVVNVLNITSLQLWVQNKENILKLHKKHPISNKKYRLNFERNNSNCINLQVKNFDRRNYLQPCYIQYFILLNLYHITKQNSVLQNILHRVLLCFKIHYSFTSFLQSSIIKTFMYYSLSKIMIPSIYLFNHKKG